MCIRDRNTCNICLIFILCFDHRDIRSFSIILCNTFLPQICLLYTSFAKALSLCDHVIVTDIYAAREKDTGIVSSKDIVDRMADYDVDVHYIKEFDDIEKFILKNCKKNDLLITMGAGNVDSIGNSLVNR